MAIEFIKDLKEISAKDILLAGGKGANLGELIKIRMPVPEGFVVATNAYWQFLEENKISEEIKTKLKEVNIDDAESVGFISDELQRLIFEGKINFKLQEDIFSYFKKLNSQFVAVRSSATAEDTTRTSWAGQLSTYLNTQKKDLIANIKHCWASLFNPRAISYRATQGLLDAEIAVAVIVQKMIDAEVSGVAFTMHPVTKDKNVIVIEAGLGLGEAMVSGMVTPDMITVDKKNLKIIDYKISRQKKKVTKEGVVGVSEEQQKERKLDKGKTVKLARFCLKIESHFKTAQDIEWALAKDELFILQSRLITPG